MFVKHRGDIENIEDHLNCDSSLEDNFYLRHRSQSTSNFDTLTQAGLMVSL